MISLAWKVGPQETARRNLSKRELVAKILTFRLGYLFLMATSCALIPDHSPGDDVLRFDLRLTSYDDSDQCFCLPEHDCAECVGHKKMKNYTFCDSPSSSSFLLPTAAWKFALSPLTKWDAARFLHLAVRPSLRDPPPSCLKGDVSTCDFSDSEQAHAFFPFFPTLLRYLALCWVYVAPSTLLPPTFECLVVLTGFFVNTVCLVVSTLSLLSLTTAILPMTISIDSRRRVAVAACLVHGIWNPASVFFATNYSESLFSALTLAGHAAFYQQQYVVALPLWSLASWTRSNGTIHCIWLLIQMLGHISHLFGTQASKKIRQASLVSAVARIFLFALWTIVIFLPVRYHDQSGYSRNCRNDSTIRPKWCLEGSSSFSLYGWTQRQHWNVGFFRYYELKHIPNFLLAAPILALSSLAVFLWIRDSMVAYGKGKVPSTPYMILIGWPVQALADSVASESTFSPAPPTAVHDFLISNPKLLGHYAILAGLALVGLLVAHVQISTRMICSSSPAMTWFLTYILLQDENPRLRQFVKIYTALYMLLGVILHVNCLPWT